MAWFRSRSPEYLDDHPDGYAEGREFPRREAFGGGLFILASAVAVAKGVDWQFDRIFFIATAVGLVLLAVTRYRLAYVAAATGWMAYRLFRGIHREPGVWPWALALGALTLLLIYVSARSESDKETRWRRRLFEREDKSLRE